MSQWEKPRPVQSIEFDLEKGVVISVNGIMLKGYCKRCGECCKDFFQKPRYEGRCDFLLDGEGGTVHFCMTYSTRPMICNMFPNDPEQELAKTCGYYWEENDEKK